MICSWSSSNVSTLSQNCEETVEFERDLMFVLFLEQRRLSNSSAHFRHPNLLCPKSSHTKGRTPFIVYDRLSWVIWDHVSASCVDWWSRCPKDCWTIYCCGNSLWSHSSFHCRGKIGIIPSLSSFDLLRLTFQKDLWYFCMCFVWWERWNFLLIFNSVVSIKSVKELSSRLQLC